MCGESMDSIKPFLQDQERLALVEEYTSLGTIEDRLTYLMERVHLHAPLAPTLLTDERKVPGCLSGLWLHATQNHDRFYFAAKSDSAIVQGVSSLLCDLYSGRSGDEIRSIDAAFGSLLGLDRLLSLTRRRAISTTISFILATARSGLPHGAAD